MSPPAILVGDSGVHSVAVRPVVQQVSVQPRAAELVVESDSEVSEAVATLRGQPGRDGVGVASVVQVSGTQLRIELTNGAATLVDLPIGAQSPVVESTHALHSKRHELAVHGFVSAYVADADGEEVVVAMQRAGGVLVVSANQPLDGLVLHLFSSVS